MDRDQIKAAILVMQAYVDGEEIEQSPIGDGWGPVHEPVWDWYQNDYRIKPKPREFWVRIDHGIAMQISSDDDKQDRDGWIKVREVIENE